MKPVKLLTLIGLQRRFRQMEAVSDPRLGQDVAGLVRFRLYLSTQLLYKYSQILHFIPVIGAPDRLEKFPVRNGSVGMKRQISKQVELFRREPHLAATDDEFARLKVDLDIIEGEAVWPRFRS